MVRESTETPSAMRSVERQYESIDREVDISEDPDRFKFMVYRKEVEKQEEFNNYVSDSEANSDVAEDAHDGKQIMSAADHEDWAFFERSVKLQKEGTVSLLKIIQKK